MTEGCGSDTPPRSVASVGAAPPLALITCCYWSVKSEYAFSLLKVLACLVQGGPWVTARLGFMMCSSSEFVLLVALLQKLNSGALALFKSKDTLKLAAYLDQTLFQTSLVHSKKHTQKNKKINKYIYI